MWSRPKLYEKYGFNENVGDYKGDTFFLVKSVSMCVEYNLHSVALNLLSAHKGLLLAYLRKHLPAKPLGHILNATPSRLGWLTRSCLYVFFFPRQATFIGRYALSTVFDWFSCLNCTTNQSDVL